MSHYQSPPLKGLCIPGSLFKWGSQTAAAAWPGTCSKCTCQPQLRPAKLEILVGSGEHAHGARENSCTWFWFTGKPETPCILQERKVEREVWGLAPSFPDDQDEIKRKATVSWTNVVFSHAPSLGNSRHSQEQIMQMRGPVIHVHQPSCLRHWKYVDFSKLFWTSKSCRNSLTEKCCESSPLNSAEFSIRLFKEVYIIINLPCFSFSQCSSAS